MDHLNLYKSFEKGLQMAICYMDSDNNKIAGYVQLGVILEGLRICIAEMESDSTEEECEEEICPECKEEEIQERKEIVNFLKGFKATLEDFEKFKEKMKK